MSILDESEKAEIFRQGFFLGMIYILDLIRQSAPLKLPLRHARAMVAFANSMEEELRKGEINKYIEEYTTPELRAELVAQTLAAGSGP